MELNYLEQRLLNACDEQRIDTVKAIILDIDNVNFEDDNGNFPLKLAVVNNNIDIVQILLDSYAMPNWVSCYHDFVLSSIATIDMLQLLMKHGLDIHYQEDDIESPLQYIIDSSNLGMVQALMQLGVKYQHLDLSSLFNLNFNNSEDKTYIEAIQSIIEKDKLNQVVLETKELYKDSNKMKI